MNLLKTLGKYYLTLSYLGPAVHHRVDRGYAFPQGGPLHRGAGREIRTGLQLLRRRDGLWAHPYLLQRQAGGDAGSASEVTRAGLSLPPSAGVQAL